MAQSDPRYVIEGATAEQQQAVDLLAKQFLLTDERLAQVIKEFRRRMEEGLAADGRVLKMIPSYVTRRPTGTETGSYFAIDLGGTNLRVLRVTLDGKGGVATEYQKFVLSEEAKSRTLFDFIAQCVETFLDDHNIRPTGQQPVHMGLTFSYPVQQTSINSGTLVQWTKGLNVPGCVGRDVVRLLQDALLRLGLRVK
ncbi:hexokinase, partial [Coemansia sp. RSA 2610]